MVKPFQEKELAAALEIARGRYQEVLKLEQEVGDLKEALETRKLVERAKAILMNRHGLSEQEAMRRLQTQSMNTRRPIKEIAQAVILAADTVG